MTRRLAEPLLWFALAVGVLWAIVLLAAVTLAPLDVDNTPVADGIALQAAVLAVALLVPAGRLLAARPHPAVGRGLLLVTGVVLLLAGRGFGRIGDIEQDLAAGYQVVPMLAGTALMVLGALPWREPENPPRPVSGAGLAVAATAVTAWSFMSYATWGWLGVHEEEQPAWDYGMPEVLLLVGLAATVLYLFRRRWWAAVLALVVAVGAFAGTMALTFWAA